MCTLHTAHQQLSDTNNFCFVNQQLIKDQKGVSTNQNFMASIITLYGSLPSCLLIQMYNNIPLLSCQTKPVWCSESLFWPSLLYLLLFICWEGTSYYFMNRNDQEFRLLKCETFIYLFKNELEFKTLRNSVGCFVSEINEQDVTVTVW